MFLTNNFKINQAQLTANKLSTPDQLHLEQAHLTTRSVRSGQRRLRQETQVFAKNIQPSNELLDILSKYANNPLKIPVLNYAVMMNDERAALILIENGLNVNTYSNKGTPLEIAFSNKNTTISNLLINNGAILTGKLFDIAVRLDPENLVNLLIENNFNPNLITNNSIEFFVKNDDFVKQLVRVKYDLLKLSKQAVINAVLEGSAETVKLILSSGINVKNIQRDITVRMQRKNITIPQSLISAALGNNRFENVKVLLDFNVIPEINLFDTEFGKFEDNPLYMAIFRGINPEIFKLLIEHGAKPSPTESKYILYSNSDFGISNKGILLETAILKRNDKIVEILLDSGYPPNTPGSLNKMPIKFAVELGERNIVALLLNHGADWDGV